MCIIMSQFLWDGEGGGGGGGVLINIEGVCIYSTLYTLASPYSICRKLNHPHLACCLGVQKSSSSITIITPLVHGSNLQDMIFGDNKV